MLDCAVGTVKSRCSRGRARLAAHLGDLLRVDDEHDRDPADPGGREPRRRLARPT